MSTSILNVCLSLISATVLGRAQTCWIMKEVASNSCGISSRSAELRRYSMRIYVGRLLNYCRKIEGEKMGETIAELRVCKVFGSALNHFQGGAGIEYEGRVCDARQRPESIMDEGRKRTKSTPSDNV
ncbi:hypothetical protein B0H13DRAFT_2121696 [Mycena leptocephala]|nr:hypothetical protein B0H13DRAFT_2121696 [Mycena leptocephala]